MQYIQYTVRPNATAIEAMRTLEDHLKTKARCLEGIVTNMRTTDNFALRITLRENGEIKVEYAHPEEVEK